MQIRFNTFCISCLEQQKEEFFYAKGGKDTSTNNSSLIFANNISPLTYYPVFKIGKGKIEKIEGLLPLKGHQTKPRAARASDHNYTTSRQPRRLKFGMQAYFS